MTDRKRLAAVALAVFCLALGQGVANGEPPQAPDKPAGSWIVVLTDGTNPDTVAKAVGATPKHRYTTALSGFAADLTEAQLHKLDADDRVLSLNESRILERPEPVAETPLAATDVGAAQEIPPGHPAQIVPFGSQRVGTRESPTADIDGMPDPMDVDIAIIDTGVGPHLDLNIVGGVACASGEGFADVANHGTGVAGTAAAKDNAFGVVGVAPDARLWAVRVFNPDVTAFTENLICGLDWVAGNPIIDVANISLGEDGMDTGKCGLARGRPQVAGVAGAGDRVSLDKLKKRGLIDPLHAAVCQAVESGVTLVAAAGNQSVDAALRVPAAYPEAITVAALADFDGRPGGLDPTPPCSEGEGETDDSFATFSNFGKVVDIAAPGVCIGTTSSTGFYRIGDGTSFSAPHVAGAAALLKVRHPDWTPDRIRREIIGTAEPGFRFLAAPRFFSADIVDILNVRGY